MEGIRVLSSGLSSDQRRRTQQLVEWMGGTYVQKVAEDPDFIIAKDVTCQKYRWAMRMKKPVVSMDWLNKCWLEHRLVPVEPYRLQVFTGLEICTTGIRGSVTRNEIQALVAQHGGKFTSELQRKTTTHLIAQRDHPVICLTPGNSGEGQKYRKAKEWHVKIVSLDWVWKSLSTKECLPEEMFPVAEAIAQPGEEGALEASTTSYPSSFVRGTQSQSSLETEVPQPAAGVDQISCGIASCSTRIESSLDLQVRGSQELAECSLREVRMQEFGQGGTAQKEDNQDDMYLSACRIHMVGFSLAEEKMVVKSISRGGGTRFLEYHDSVTHILVGSPSERDWRWFIQLEAAGQCHIVWSSWLQDCETQNKLLPVDDKHRVLSKLPLGNATWIMKMDGHKTHSNGQASASKLSTSLRLTTEESRRCGLQTLAIDAAAENPCTSVLTGQHAPETHPTSKNNEGPAHAGLHGQEGSSGGKQTDIGRLNGLALRQEASVPLSCLGSEAHGASGSRISDEGPKKSAAAVLGSSQASRGGTTGGLPRGPPVFQGCTFSFAMTVTRDTKQIAMEAIREEGGELWQPGQTGQPTHVIGNHGDAAEPQEGILVSHHWLLASINEGKLLDPASHVIFRPLPCKVPLPGFSLLRICVSLYSNQDRDLIRNLSFCLGAKITDKLTKSVTHLVCRFALGEKYKTARAWGINVTTVDWLFACVAQESHPVFDLIDDLAKPALSIKAKQVATPRVPNVHTPPILQTLAQKLNLQNRGLPVDDFQPPEPTASDIQEGAIVSTQCPTQAARLASGQAGEPESRRQGVPSEMQMPARPSVALRGSQTRPQQAGERQEYSPPDVAAAIENFIGETSRVLPEKVLQGSTGQDEQANLVSPEPLRPQRRKGEDGGSFAVKRQKMGGTWHGSNMQEARNGDPHSFRVPGDEDDLDQFQESQIASQIVGYDEDLSERMRLIEQAQRKSRGRTAPSCEMPPPQGYISSSKLGTLKNVAGASAGVSLKGLQGLLRAADANTQKRQI